MDTDAAAATAAVATGNSDAANPADGHIDNVTMHHVAIIYEP